MQLTSGEFHCIPFERQKKIPLKIQTEKEEAKDRRTDDGK